MRMHIWINMWLGTESSPPFAMIVSEGDMYFGILVIVDIDIVSIYYYIGK